MVKIAAIIVSYNNDEVLPYCLACLDRQTLKPWKIVIVDNGSANKGFLEEKNQEKGKEVLFLGDNTGFSKANNLGFEKVREADYVLFLNPDAFLEASYIEKAVSILKRNREAAALTGPVFGYDWALKKEKNTYDTTGIFQKWWGRWYDRAQGDAVEEKRYQRQEEIPAICGAVFMAKQRALETILLRGREVFNEAFFMYKEDIDLSFRLRKKGWKLLFSPLPKAYHCRGWQTRKNMSKEFRVMAAANECAMHWHFRMPIAFIYSTLKWSAVKCLNI